MTARFAEVFKENGFDPTAKPPWIMVGLGSQDTVLLMNGPDLKVVSSNPSMVEVKEAKDSRPGLKTRKFVLRGKKSGALKGKQRVTTFVEAFSPGNGSKPKARLEVAVKKWKDVKVAFNFVWDSAKPPHHTERKREEVSDLITVMNAIYLPQAWVFFNVHSIRKVVVPKDLGPIVRWTYDGKHGRPDAHTWNDVVALGDKTADFNVFFVWEYEHGHMGKDDRFDAGTYGKNCLFEDNITKEKGNEFSHDATALAHEAMHFFYGPNEDHEIDGSKAHHLWFKDSRRGTFIPKKDANVANP